MDDKAKTLAKEYGFDNTTDFALDVGFESIVPGICMNPGCDASYEYEPDQDRGWCSECETNSVKSILILTDIL